MIRVLKIISILIVSLGSYAAHAQASGDKLWQGGVFYGRALPHGISQNDDIFSIWGLRLSIPMGGEKSSGGYFDGTYTSGIGGNTKMNVASAGVSLQMPVETLIAHAGIGIDVTQYESDTQVKSKVVFGEHFIGGVMARLGTSMLTRFDMKFSSAPGTLVTMALGLALEF